MSDKKIKIMREGGRKLAKIRDKVLSEVKVGVRTIELDCLAEELINKASGKASFKMVSGYKWATCICVNECIVHGVPNDYVLKKGDLVTVDVGFYYQGYHTDTATTVVVGEKDNKFLIIGQKALNKAITQARLGNRIAHISQAIQQVVERAGYNVARSLVGHGIGKKLHEKPQIPCFFNTKNANFKSSALLKMGQTLAIEVIYMKGQPEIVLDNKDNWTIRTKDLSASAMFEHTIAITKGEPIILTK